MVKRTAAALIGLMAAPLITSAQPAAATAAAGCLITGTITFEGPAAAGPGGGRWNIHQGVIDCRGVYNGWERIINPGSFSAAGTYTALPTGGPCAIQLGEGTVDYWVLTSEQDIHVKEPHTFSPGPAGAFTTPSLRGSFQILPDATCLAAGTDHKATFAAEVTLVKYQDNGITGNEG